MMSRPRGAAGTAVALGALVVLTGCRGRPRGREDARRPGPPEVVSTTEGEEARPHEPRPEEQAEKVIEGAPPLSDAEIKERADGAARQQEEQQEEQPKDATERTPRLGEAERRPKAEEILRHIARDNWNMPDPRVDQFVTDLRKARFNEMVYQVLREKVRNFLLNEMYEEALALIESDRDFASHRDYPKIRDFYEDIKRKAEAGRGR